MAPARAGCVLCLWVSQAAAQGGGPAASAALDAEGLLQTEILSSKLSASTDSFHRPRPAAVPALALDKSWKAVEEQDIATLSKMFGRQQTAEEIENIVRAVWNYTDMVKQLPELIEKAMEPLDGDIEDDQANNLTEVVRLLSVTFQSLEQLAQRHYQALEWTFSQTENAIGQAALKLMAKSLVKAAGRARLALAAAGDATALCREASRSLSEFRQNLRSSANFCDGILFALPPPLPPMNPWMNATMLEATRSMHFTSKSMLRDMDDTVVDSVSSFMRDVQGCNTEIVAPDMTLEEIGQQLARLQKAKLMLLPHQWSRAEARRQPGPRTLAAASLVSLALLRRTLSQLVP